jgi:Tol biopolymer transport system component
MREVRISARASADVSPGRRNYSARMPALRSVLSVLAAATLLAATALPAHAAFPGRDGRLVYNWGSFSESEDAPYPSRTESALQTIAPAGGMPTALRQCVRETGAPDVGDCSTSYGTPAVSPDGRWLALDAGAQLALMRFDGSGLRLLPARLADDGEPAFSPSGKRLAFTAGAIAVANEPAPPRGVWTSDRAGGDARQVTGLGSTPAWSTRNWIAFLRTDGVYRVRPSGSGLRRLVALPGCRDVAWSPGGTKLAFACLVRHRDRLYVANGDGTGMRRVVIRYASPEGVAWSPDGTRLAVADFDGTLMTVRLDGSHERVLVGGSSGANYSSGASAVDWQPLP